MTTEPSTPDPTSPGDRAGSGPAASDPTVRIDPTATPAEAGGGHVGPGDRVPVDLVGRVTAEGNGEPILGAQAKLRTADEALVGQSVTDPEGRFRIPLPTLEAAAPTAGMTHRLEVKADGYEPATVDLTLTGAPAAELPVTLAAKRPPWLWIGVGVALLVLLALLFALFSGQDTTVPDLDGVTIEEAADRLEAEELVLGEVTFSDAGPDVARNTVLGSDPEAGATAEVGTAVDLTAAEGIAEDPTVAVPRVTGRQESDAVRLLDALRFDVVIERVASQEPAGIVVAQGPEPRSEAAVGDEVRIDISEGPAEDATEPEPGAEPEPGTEPEPEPGTEPEPEPGTEPETDPAPGAEPETDPAPGAEGDDGDGAQLPDVELPDVELPDVELPEIDEEQVRGFFERIVEWFQDRFGG